jgi:adenylate kinase
VTRLIFLGPPGAGKGTQAILIAQQQSVPHISTGDILREAVAQRTPLGEQAHAFMSQGELVPDDLVLGLVEERLKQSDTDHGWVLDGFPRTVPQSLALDQLLVRIEQQCDLVINLDVPDARLIERLLARGRADDSQDVISRRLEVYRQQTAPLIQYYGDRHLLQTVDGDAAVELITQRILTKITDRDSQS